MTVGLSKYGILADVDPFNLPPEAFSMGINVRFKNQSITQAPVFRRVPQTLLFSDPRFVGSNLSNAGFDSVIVGYCSLDQISDDAFFRIWDGLSSLFAQHGRPLLTLEGDVGPDGGGGEEGAVGASEADASPGVAELSQ
jgi:hypothetical protein